MEMSKRNIPNEMAEDLMNLFYEKTYNLKKGIHFGGCHVDEVSDLVNRSLFLANHDSITLKISKSEDRYHVNINIEDIYEPK